MGYNEIIAVNKLKSQPSTILQVSPPPPTPPPPPPNNPPTPPHPTPPRSLIMLHTIQFWCWPRGYRPLSLVLIGKPSSLWNWILRVGIRHIVFTALHALGKTLEGSGTNMCASESGTYTPAAQLSGYGGKAYKWGLEHHITTSQAIIMMKCDSFFKVIHLHHYMSNVLLSGNLCMNAVQICLISNMTSNSCKLEILRLGKSQGPIVGNFLNFFTNVSSKCISF